MTLDTLLGITTEIKEECFELKNVWHEDDVRHSFFGMFYSTIYDFYIGKIGYRMSEYIGTSDIKFTGDIISFKPHALRLYEIQNSDILSQGYINKLNRDIFLGSWTCFETTISLLFNNLSNLDERKKIVIEMNNKLLKIISKLEVLEKETLTDIILKSPFIPLVRKFKFLRKIKPELYSNEDYKKDCLFLEFCSKLRNCLIHSNGIYNGQNSEYEFMGCLFKFKNGQVLEQENSEEYTLFHIGFKLKEVFYKLTKCLSDVKYIEYPNDGQNIV